MLDRTGMPQPGSLWRHYKGTLYQVLGEARYEPNGEVLILYRAHDDPDGIPWARAWRTWQAPTPKGEPRFTPES